MAEKEYKRDESKRMEQERGMMLGMLICFPLGVALFLATGNPGLIGVGVAAGLPIGMAIGEKRFRQKHGEE